MPPTAVPKTTPPRDGSTAGAPAFSQASRAAASDSAVTRSILRASRRPKRSSASKPLTSAATSQVIREGSNSVTGPRPLVPALSASHVSVIVVPTGVSAPMPVMTI